MIRNLLLSNRHQAITLLRFTPIFLGFSFSLYYSKLMGIENRSILTFVLLVNTILSFLLLSGLGIKIRTSESFHASRDLVPAYLVTAFLISLTVSIIMVFTSLLVSRRLAFFHNVSLPDNALLAIAIYSLMASLSLPMFDLISTLQSFKAFIFVESLVVMVQLCIFSILVAFQQTTLFVSVLLAYSLSYAFLIFSVLVLLISNNYFSFAIRHSFSLLFRRDLFRNFLNGLMMNLIERADKVLLPLFYASPQLGQVSLFSGILGFLRVIPDTEIRISQNSNMHGKKRLKGKRHYSALGKVFGISLFVFFANLIVYFVLGIDWLLPLHLVILLTIYEVLVWKSKTLLAQVAPKNGNGLTFVNTCFILFYLLPLPILMFYFDYTLVLAGLSVVTFGWYRLAKHMMRPKLVH